jgi:hypothetical protein
MALPKSFLCLHPDRVGIESNDFALCLSFVRYCHTRRTDRSMSKRWNYFLHFYACLFLSYCHCVYCCESVCCGLHSKYHTLVGELLDCYDSMMDPGHKPMLHLCRKLLQIMLMAWRLCALGYVAMLGTYAQSLPLSQIWYIFSSSVILQYYCCIISSRSTSEPYSSFLFVP